MRRFFQVQLPAFLAQITAPYPFKNKAEAYRAQLLAGVSLALLLMVIPAFIIQIIRGPFDILEMITLISAGVLLITYRLSQSRRYADGANLLIMTAFLGCFAVIVFYWNPAEIALIFIPILLASFFYSFHQTILLIVISSGLAAYLILTQIASMDEVLFVTFFLAIYSVLIMVATGLRQYFEDTVVLLQQSEARYRTAAQNSLDAFYLMESVRDAKDDIVDFRIMEVNAVAEKRSGLTYDQMVGAQLQKLFPQSGPQGFFQKFKQVVNSKENITEEYHTPMERIGPGWYYQQVIPVGDGIAIISRDIGAQKRSEAALQESERRFRELAENSPDVIMIVDVESTKPLYVNRDEFLAVDMKIFKEEGKLIDFVHPDDREETQLGAQAVLKGDMRYDIMEYRVLNLDGGWEWVQSRKTILAHDENGLPARILATLSVITERKNSEVELRESEARFRNLFDQASEAIILHDTLGQIVDVNQEACHNLGYTYDELIKLNVADFDVRWHDKVMDGSGQYRGNGFPDIAEATYCRKNGESFPVEIRANWFEHYDERKLIIAYVRDITERKQSEYDLRESEERYRSLFEGSINPVMLLDGDGTILILNQIAARNLGRSITECIGHQLHEFVPQMQASLLPHIRQVMQSNRAVQVEDELTTFEGTTYWYWSSIQPVIAGNGEVYAAQIISYDITEQKLAERDRHDLEMERNRTHVLRQVIDIVSHDLMTPITTMNTSLYLLQKTYPDERQRDRLTKMQEQLDSVTKMVQDMLLLMKLETPGRYIFEFGTGHIEPVIEGIMTTYQETAQAQDIKLQMVTMPTLPIVTFDRKMISQVIINLVDNALKFSGRGGQVTVRLQQQDDKLCIEVQDEGRGIEADQLPYIFKSLYKGDEHRPANSGSGIGLSIAKHIVDAHRGTIEVESEVGVGTSFHIYLPLACEIQAT